MDRFKIKFLSVFACLMAFCALPVIAADGNAGNSGGLVLDFGSFTGIVAVISTLVTQVFKAIPAIKETTIAKIGISVVTGVAVCMLAWVLKIAPAMEAVPTWWGALIYGVAAGLSGCGFYDVVKAVAALFKKGDSPVL